jgi:hypothetical protein
MLAVVGVLVASTGTASAAGEIAIVCDSNGETARYAVDEFMHLAQTISGRSCATTAAATVEQIAADELVVISTCSATGLVAALADAGAVDLGQIPASNEGFLLQTIAYNGRRVLLIVSRGDIGLLYGVYDYFEQYCGAGYFVDGDHLPRGPLVFDSVNRACEPVLRYRGTSAWTAHRGLSKNFSQSWDYEHWKRFLTWMAKSKLNLLAGYELAPENNGGDVYCRAFPGVYKPFPEGPPAGADVDDPERHFLGAWVKDPVAQGKLTQRVFALGEMLGIEFANSYEYGKVYPAFVDKHPEYSYVSSLLEGRPGTYDVGKTWDLLMPGTEVCKDYTSKLWKTIYDEYGSNNLWRLSYFSEVVSFEGMNIAEWKLKAVKEQAAIIQQIDPDPTILIDTWGMEGWPRDEQEMFWVSLPSDVNIIAFQTNQPPNQQEFFRGHPWIFNPLHSYAGTVCLHTENQLSIECLKRFIQHKESGIVGYTHGSEKVDNPYSMQMDAALAWSPVEFDEDAYLCAYVRRRYGDDSYANMLLSMRELRVAMGWFAGYAGDRSKHSRMIEAYLPGFMKAADGGIGADERRVWEEGHKGWKRALRFALQEAEAQVDNDLYHNDIVDLTWQLIDNELSLALVNQINSSYNRMLATDGAERATAAGALLAELKRVDEMYADIIALLSTDPRYSIQRDIDRLMAQKGVNSFTPVQYQRWGIHPYCAFPAVEYYRDYYYPMFQIYARALVEDIQSGKPPEQYLTSQALPADKMALWRQAFNQPLSPISDTAKARPSIEVIREMYGKYGDED